jgi:hypothetical protein
MNGRVFKKTKVKVSGSKQLAVRSSGGGGGPRARARVVTDKKGNVLIEVTCACGEVIQLQCAGPSAAPKAPATSETPASAAASAADPTLKQAVNQAAKANTPQGV